MAQFSFSRNRNSDDGKQEKAAEEERHFRKHLNVSKYLKNNRHNLSSRRSRRQSSLSLEILTSMMTKTMMASRRRQQKKKGIFIAPQCVEVLEEQQP
ncbi:hypothetical protein CEXT_743731 [Caerostris extrusa]|uniref:Uncharacterized protein n=1 Tax=Caerostris extrusa TaxID=172846 RepID=A0AAV4NAE9_CAEEX|nr:hypothetical protein CEXT_743731 [Caerostris extrusa]